MSHAVASPYAPEPRSHPDRAPLAHRLWWSVRMTGQTAREAAVEVARLTFGSRVTWAILVGGIMLGMWVQAKISAVDAVNARQGEILSTVQQVQSTLETMRDNSKDAKRERDEMRVKIQALEGELKRQEGERRVLEDYVEGRIGKMPYRPPGGE